MRVAGTGLVITFKADSQTPVLAPAQENPVERTAQHFLRETPYALLFSANNNEVRAMAHDGSRVFAPFSVPAMSTTIYGCGTATRSWPMTVGAP